MNDTTANTAESVSPVEAERRLIRPTEGRRVAGVAAGLARYFGISPTVYRVAFVALALLGGSGFILYAAAWLVIPDERRGESVVEEAIRGRRDRPWLALGVVLVGIGLVLGISGGHIWPNAFHGWLTALVVGLALVGWQLHEPRSASAGRRSGVSALETSDAAPVARRRFPVFAVTLGAIVAATGVLGLLDATSTVDVDWTLALAGGVLLVGVAIAAGAFFGGVGPLAVLGTFLAAILLAVSTVDVPLHGPIGDRTVHPASVQALRDTYRQAVGNLELDLTTLALPSGRTTVTASVGIGKLVVRVPEDAFVVAKTSVTAGDTELFGSNVDGWHVDRTVNSIGPTTGADAPTLVLDTTVGLGKVEVLRG